MRHRFSILLVALLLAFGTGLFALQPAAVDAGIGSRPVVTIITPVNNQVFTQGDPIQFSGAAIDQENGALCCGAMVWRSTIQAGDLGTGTSFSRSDLNVGAHTVTLRAIDPAGRLGQMSVRFTVIAPATPTSTASPTNTPTDTPTNTPTQTPTDTPTPTHTATAVPPTSTNTPSPTHTSTPVPPTATRTPTSTPSPTLTPTPRPSTRPCADVDGNGRVTGQDLSSIVLALIRNQRDLRFDVNYDGSLNLTDAWIAVRQLGQRCSRGEPVPTPTRTSTPTKTAAPVPTKTPTHTPAPGEPTATPTVKLD